MASTRLRGVERQAVDAEVGRILVQSRAFATLPMREQEEIRRHTAAIAESMAASLLAERRQARHRKADPYAATLGDDYVAAPPGGPSSPPTSSQPRGSGDRWRPDERFQAEGIAAGVTQAGRMLNEIDFPRFVSSLVQGTFQAIVDASIQQMKAYADLVQAVAMSLNDFRDQNVTEGQAGEHLVQRYPSIFEIGIGDGGAAAVRAQSGAGMDNLPDFAGDLGLEEEVSSLDDETIRDVLLPAARTQLAKQRQQLLATMVLMGINRIIVTDGKINAKLRFNFSAHDAMNRQGTVADYLDQKKVVAFDVAMGADRYLKGRVETPVPLLVSTTTGSTAAEINASALVSGDVSINFKSETFPLERMADAEQMMKLNQAQRGAGRGAPPPQGAPSTDENTKAAAVPAP